MRDDDKFGLPIRNAAPQVQRTFIRDTSDNGFQKRCVVPRCVEHRTMAESEAEVLVFEPAQTRNTGNIVDPQFTAPNGVVI